MPSVAIVRYWQADNKAPRGKTLLGSDLSCRPFHRANAKPDEGKTFVHGSLYILRKKEASTDESRLIKAASKFAADATSMPWRRTHGKTDMSP